MKNKACRCVLSGVQNVILIVSIGSGFICPKVTMGFYQTEEYPDSLVLVDLEQLGMDESYLADESVNGLSAMAIQDVCSSVLCLMSDQGSFTFGMGLPSSSASKLGPSYRMWMAYNVRFLLNWRLELAGKKDVGEPIYVGTKSPWFLMESKRAAVIYSGTWFNMVVGDFRVTQSDGTVSGSGWSEFSTPLTLSTIRGNRLRIGPNAGNHAKPSRRGVAIQMGPFKGLKTIVFAHQSELTGSFNRSHMGEGPLIEGVSSTYVFDSESSIERRNAVTAQGWGIATGLEVSRFSGSVFFERFTFYSKLSTLLQPDWIGDVSARYQTGVFSGKLALSGSSSGLGRAIIEIGLSSRTKGSFKLGWELNRNTFLAPFGTGRPREYASSNIVAALRTPRINGYQVAMGVIGKSKQQYSVRKPSGAHQLESIYGVVTVIKKQGLHLEWSSQASYRLMVNTDPLLVLSPESTSLNESKSQLNQSVKLALNNRVSIRTQWIHARDSKYAMVRNVLGVSTELKWKRFSASTAWSVASNDAHSTGSGTSYFAAPNVKGFFPVSGITGNGSSTTVLIGYENGPFQIEFHIAESNTRTFEGIKSDRSGFSYQFQMTIKP